MNSTAISIQALTRKAAQKNVLSNISLTIPSGQIYGVLGLNGSGKTSLLKIIVGLLQPSSGTIEILNHTPSHMDAVRRKIGYIPEGKDLYGYMRIGEFIKFCRSLSPSWDEKEVQKHLEIFRLSLKTKISALTQGERNMLYFITTLGGKPDLLVLDEPMEGFDTVTAHSFISMLLEYMNTEGRTVLMATHDITAISGITDHIGVLKAGELIYTGSCADILENYCKVRIVPKDMGYPFLNVPGVYDVEYENRSALVKISHSKEQALHTLREVPHVFMDVIPINIKEIYVEMAKEADLDA